MSYIIYIYSYSTSESASGKRSRITSSMFWFHNFLPAVAALNNKKIRTQEAIENSKLFLKITQYLESLTHFS